jgi:hypothetical protein
MEYCEDIELLVGTSYLSTYWHLREFVSWLLWLCELDAGAHEEV